LDGGTGNNHAVEFDGEWWGIENILPRELHHDLKRALLSGAKQWREFPIVEEVGRMAA
jgi:hypothetical protein